MNPVEEETLSKIEVLADLEPVVADLMAAHEAKRVLWFPAELLEPPPGEDPDHHLRALRERARGISDPARVALALNLLTEEGLPHFHRLLAVYLGTDSIWAKWNNLWTAEEDRHGAILHDYTRDAGVFDPVVIEKMQFDYIKAGFEPEWDRDPYRVFVYTSLQERATQVSHANTGKFASQYEPTIGTVLQNVAKEEARHYTFYRSVFKAVLERDPSRADVLNDLEFSNFLLLPSMIALLVSSVLFFTRWFSNQASRSRFEPAGAEHLTQLGHLGHDVLGGDQDVEVHPATGDAADQVLGAVGVFEGRQPGRKAEAVTGGEGDRDVLHDPGGAVQARFGQDADELVAAPADEQVGGAEAAPEGGGQLRDLDVAGGVPLLVVDRLKAVHRDVPAEPLEHAA